MLLDAVRAAGGGPVGLGARDTLRLEAGMPLYGNELDLDTNPYEAGLGRVVKLDKPGDFVGRAALEKVARDGPERRLVGLVVEGRGIARHGHPVWSGDRRTGVVTSGTQSPTLGVPIAMAYVAPGDAEPGTVVEVEIRETRDCGTGRRPAVLQEGCLIRWCRPICATPTITNGSASTATRRRSGSRPTPPISSATSSSSSCRRWVARSDRPRRSASSNRSRP